MAFWAKKQNPYSDEKVSERYSVPGFISGSEAAKAFYESMAAARRKMGLPAPSYEEFIGDDDTLPPDYDLRGASGC